MKWNAVGMIFSVLAGGLLLGLAGCMNASLSRSGSAPTSLSLQQVPDGISEVELTVSGSGMSQITKTITAGTDAVVIEVPVGTDRVFRAEAGGYTARAVRDVPAGGVQVALRFAAGVLLFSANWDGDYDIYTVATGGAGEPKALTINGARDASPQYTADGTKIVFESDRSAASGFDIYSMNSDGSNQTLLAPTSDFYNIWTVSPDSRTVAFFADFDEDGDEDIYTVPVSGGTVTQLVENTTGTTGGSQLRWSPDGSKLLYQADFDGDGFQEMGVVDSNGANQGTLFEESSDTGAGTTTTLSGSFWLGQSGSALVYQVYTYNSSTFQAVSYAITSVSADPQAPNAQVIHSTTNGSLGGFMPSFSGESILFISDATESPEVYVDSVAGGTATRLTNNALDEAFAFWIPGDELIAVQLLDVETPSGFLIGSPDGSGGFEIAADTPGDTLAGWSPDGGTVVFIRDESGGQAAREEVLYTVNVSNGVDTPSPMFPSQGEGTIDSVQWQP